MHSSDSSETRNGPTTAAQVLLESAAERLPTPDGVAVAIMEAWEKEDTTVQQLARLVQTDPALSGRVLKLANSAAQGRRPVASIPEAIVRIGMQTVGQLAVAFSLIGKEVNTACPAFDHQKYWSRCLLMAVLSRQLGTATRLAPPDDLFACGLLGRIGVLALVSVYPEAYNEILDNSESDLIAQEKETFGVDHNEVSEAMMLNFSVPRALAEPARFHEQPDQSGFAAGSRPKKLAQLLNLSYRLSAVAMRDDGKVAGPAELVDSIGAQLGLEEERIGSLFDEAIAEWKEWSEILDMPADHSREYQALEFAEIDESQTSNEEERSVDFSALRVVTLMPDDWADPLLSLLQEISVRSEKCSKTSIAMHLAMNRRANVFLVAREGNQLIDLIRQSESCPECYLVEVLETLDEEAVARSYARGVDHVIQANISAPHLRVHLEPAVRRLAQHNKWRNDRKELRRVAKELALAHRQQQVLSLTDQLTELPNRRAAMEALERSWSLSQREDKPFSLMLLDIDHFKDVNDRFGHAVGDQVLKSTSTILQNAVRRDEMIARIGGEEFILVNTGATLREAVVAAERLRQQLANSPIDAAGQAINITVSIGIAAREDAMNNAGELMIAADKALYAAKETGRNKIALFASGKVRFLPGKN
ncbi:MAG: GGDEF domain-containing protein [Wenzhouxiangella sp.]|jgi:diguanylate cyclase (GGDEF)-like protein|nr:GGDEF domain-containing protein [Wenzhouxiangella sp.]